MVLSSLSIVIVSGVMMSDLFLRVDSLNIRSFASVSSSLKSFKMLALVSSWLSSYSPTTHSSSGIFDSLIDSFYVFEPVHPIATMKARMVIKINILLYFITFFVV